MAKRSNTEEFIKKAQLVHGDKYDYSKVNYINSKTKVCIICHKKNEFNEEHGEFWQRPNDHLNGNGCKYCNNEYIPSTDEWIRKAKNIHGNKYDYSKVEYVNSKTKVCIICPIHGEFWQSPCNHLFGKCGCPKCNSNKKSVLERNIELLLDSNNILYEREKTFDWLKNKANLYLDFYISEYKIAIECQGEQHYRPISKFGGEAEYKKIIQRDFIKFNLCKNHGIEIIYVDRKNIKKYNIIKLLNEAADKEK